MSDFLNTFWQKRLVKAQEALENNNFEAHIAQSLDQAQDIVLTKILPESKPKLVSWGGSMTLQQSGILDELHKKNGLTLLDPFDKNVSREENSERRRQTLPADLFFTGAESIIKCNTHPVRYCHGKALRTTHA